MKRVYCLYRVSDKGQIDKNDIPMQRIACHTFAECHGWEIIKEYSEKGVSGYKRHMDERDVIVQIKECAQMGKFDILLVFTFDRIGRRDDETPFVVEWLTRQGIAVWSVCEGEQCFDNHVDKLTNYIRYWQAAGESERISERTRTRIRQLTSEGFFTGGICPYGYQLVRKGRVNKKGQPLYDLMICPDEARVVRFIFEKSALEGYGAYRLANLLNSNKMFPKSGHTWNPTSLYGILKNPLYTGVLHKGGEETYQAHLQIVDKELFRDAQELRKAKNLSSERTVSSTRGSALLSGFLYCGACGSRMAANHVVRHHKQADGTVKTSRTRRYYCPQRKAGEPCECNGQHTYVATKVDMLVETQLGLFLYPLLEQTAHKIAEQAVGTITQELLERLQLAETQQHTLCAEIELLQNELVACLNGVSEFLPQHITQALRHKEETLCKLGQTISGIKCDLSREKAVIKEFQFQIEKHKQLWQEYQSASISRKKVILSQFVRCVKISKAYQIDLILSECVNKFTMNCYVAFHQAL